MKEIKSQKYVLFILRSAFYFMTIFTLFWTVGILANLGTIKSTGEMVCLVLCVLQAGDYTFLAYNLAEIVECNIYTIFSIKNSNNFKKLGYGMIFLSMIEEISNFFNESGFDIVALKETSLKTTSVIFFIIGLTNIYLSHVFKEGKRIKEENDLTI
ncbi:DUF2975 domain-containing protein [Clostridium sp. ATCC 25772]|uniref:DUF2975 domain-containing protein n=1 Tax=Clostridium sp. ATCC 25772 TaxID=1676991 RepID=UPI0007824E64|nr:DUF2975 domain-containing protein [Clostridium sp. ATCC 25772]